MATGLLPPEQPRAQLQQPVWGQLIRWIPGSENGGAAGSMWNSFCKKHDGGKGNGQREGERREEKDSDTLHIDGALVATGEPHGVRSEVHDGKTTRYTTYSNVGYDQAIFTMEFDWGHVGPPSAENDWLLSENPCWPSAIVPDDPGYALLTNDNWYKTHPFPEGYDAAATKALYAKPAPQAIVKAAQGKQAQGGDGSSHKRDLGDSLERLEVVANGLAVRDDRRNSSRLLSEADIARNVEVVRCEDRTCSKERRDLKRSEDFLYIPGQGPAMVLSANLAVPTLVTVVKRAELGVTRQTVNANVPAITRDRS